MKNKRDRFISVASYRTNQVIKYLRLLANCANRNNYDYSELEINKIFLAVDEELRSTKAKFRSIKRTPFKL